MSPLPKPAKLGLPPAFTCWRRGQDKVVSRLLEWDSRFAMLVSPTGSGKSLAYASLATIKNLRTIILTATRSQQNQVVQDYGMLPNWSDVRGQRNYTCLVDEPHTVAEGPCHAGIRCDLRAGGCFYYDAVRKAGRARVVVSNYAFWLHANAYSEGIGTFDLMVCDEAHDAENQLAQFLSVYLSRRECEKLIGSTPPDTGWQRWATTVKKPLEEEVDVARPDSLDRAATQKIVRLKHLLRLLNRLAFAKSDSWVYEPKPEYGYRWDPVSPAPFAESLLFRETPQVLLVSATITDKTMQLLGIGKGKYKKIDQPSTFPVSRRPVIHVKTCMVNYRTEQKPLTQRLMLNRIDQIIKPRLDRKGIIHAVSYSRMVRILESKYRRYMLHHQAADRIADTIKEFKQSKPPRILLSPSVHTGDNFPYEQCEYQIIPKVPFPDQRSLILKARARSDKEYPFYLAMQYIVQACGRGNRAEDDSCETIITDDSFTWFLRKYKRFAPSWFLEAVRWKAAVPPPLPKLRRKP